MFRFFAVAIFPIQLILVIWLVDIFNFFDSFVIPDNLDDWFEKKKKLKRKIVFGWS